MQPVLVVSPHLDDAVLSVGEFLSSWPGARVLTVFTGIPDPPQVSSFDVHSGFADSGMAVLARCDEDDRALAQVHGVPLRAGLLDHQYVDERDDDATIAEIRQVLVATVEAIEATKLIGPLGIAHPDHVLTSIAVAHAALETGIEVWAYEELPNRVALPETVPEALDRWRALGFDPQLGFLGAGSLDAKRRAIAQYQSQLWALDPRCLDVPERTWRLWPTG